MGIIEDSYETIIYEDKHRGKVWKEYLENLYDEPELTWLEIEHEDEIANCLKYDVLREEFDETLRDLIT